MHYENLLLFFCSIHIANVLRYMFLGNCFSIFTSRRYVQWKFHLLPSVIVSIRRQLQRSTILLRDAVHSKEIRKHLTSDGTIAHTLTIHPVCQSFLCGIIPAHRRARKTTKQRLRCCSRTIDRVQHVGVAL